MLAASQFPKSSAARRHAAATGLVSAASGRSATAIQALPTLGVFVSPGIDPKAHEMRALLTQKFPFQPAPQVRGGSGLVQPGGELGRVQVRTEIKETKRRMVTPMSGSMPAQSEVPAQSSMESGVHKVVQSRGFFPSVLYRNGMFVDTAANNETGLFGKRKRFGDDEVFFVDGPAMQGFERRLTELPPPGNYGVTDNAWRGRVWKTAGTIAPTIFA